MNVSDSSDSSSEDEASAALFLSVCDPTFATSHTTSSKDRSSIVVDVPVVTGDSVLDRTIHDLKQKQACAGEISSLTNSWIIYILCHIFIVYPCCLIII